MAIVDTSDLLAQLDEKYRSALDDEDFKKDTSKITKAINGITYATKESRRRKQLMVTVRKQLMGQRDMEYRSTNTYRPVEDHEVLAAVEAKLKE